MHKIYRYSNYGFEPQHQSNMLKEYNTPFEQMLRDCTTDYMRHLVKNHYKEPEKNFEFDGVFVFLHEPTLQDKSFYLSHLSEKDFENLNLNEAIIDIDATCYVDNGFVFRPDNKMTIKEAVGSNYVAIYLPKSQLSKIKIHKK